MTISKRDLNTLKGIREIITMERSNFDLGFTDDALPLKASEVTDFIRERTRLWRESWLLEPLDELIARNT